MTRNVQTIDSDRGGIILDWICMLEAIGFVLGTFSFIEFAVNYFYVLDSLKTI